MMRIHLLRAPACAAALLAAAASTAQEWSEFRGPGRQGRSEAAGLLDALLVFDFATAVIGSEIALMLKRAAQGLEFGEETLALDVIDEVGPHGHYLDHKHTLKHFRKEWYPKLFDTGKYEDWVAAGSKTLAQRAGERVDEILAKHQPEPLPPDVKKRIDEIVEGGAG